MAEGVSFLDRLRALMRSTKSDDPAAYKEAKRLADERDNLRLSQSQSETTFIGTQVPGSGSDKPDRQ